MKGTLIKYIATPMLVTLVIRLENGEEITLPLEDDLLGWIIGDHQRVSYTFSEDKPGGPPPPDKITCQIESGAVVKTLVETNGIETEE